MRTVTFTPRPRTSGWWISLVAISAVLLAAQLVVVAVRIAFFPFAEGRTPGVGVWFAGALWLGTVVLVAVAAQRWPRIPRTWQPLVVLAGPSAQAVSFALVAMGLGLALFGSGANGSFGRTVVFLTAPVGLVGALCALLWALWLIAASHGRP